LDKDARWLQLVREVKGLPDSPLKHLVEELEQAIVQAGGLWHPRRQASYDHLWNNDLPRLVPAAECWERPMAEKDEIIDDVLLNSKPSTAIYLSGPTNKPLKSESMNAVWECYRNPNPDKPYVATNILMKQWEMEIPARCTECPTQITCIKPTSNISPKLSAVAPHVGE
jgi:hypothetical protein